MKKNVLILAFFLGILFLLENAEAADRKKWTVMVYMCGSNLESTYGSATGDLQEMMGADFPSDQIAVLVMTGGSSHWNIGFDASETAIHEILPGRQRTVWRSEEMNMGEPGTLTRFISYAVESYPAENYALVLWDHGGGPMEGVCLDEQHEMDSLSLSELTEGLNQVYNFNFSKLRWIGFDACLMGTVEVASALAPYADYMIASQETEPATGWNYAFLTDLAEDESPEETGKRIVDRYFEGREDTGDLLTMACVDLSRIQRVISCMDVFFSPLAEEVSSNTFPSFSMIRNSTGEFGQATRLAGQDGYDLVDLQDLISRYNLEHETLSEALREAVVYSRANMEGASGLSVYHPYFNKKAFLASWRRDYRRLNFSPEYARYLERFGEFLTGDNLVDWRNLRTESEKAAEVNTVSFSLELTEEQRTEFLSGQLMILDKPFSGNREMNLSPVTTDSAWLDGDGVLRGTYSGKALYLTDDQGSILGGPIGYTLSEDGLSYLLLAYYFDRSTATRPRDTAAVMLQAVLNPDTGDLEIVHRYVYDPAQKCFTSRIPFSEEWYTEICFDRTVRCFPGETLEIPGFSEWELFKGYYRNAVKTNQPWKLHFVDQWESNPLYAMFQITDIRQNVWSSIPVFVENPTDASVILAAAYEEREDLPVSFSMVRKRTATDPSVELNITVGNRTGKEMLLKTTRMILNGHRMTDQSFWIDSLNDGETEEKNLSFRGECLRGLTELTSIDFTLSIWPERDYKAQIDIPVHLDLKNCGLSGIADPLPETIAAGEIDGMTCRLLSFWQDTEGDFHTLLNLRNDSDREVNTPLRIGINQTLLPFGDSILLYPGTDANYMYTLRNGDTLLYLFMRVTDAGKDNLLGVDQAVEQEGDSEIGQLNLFFGMNDIIGSFGNQLSLQLPEPIRLQEQKDIPEGVLMLTGDITVKLESMLIGDDAVALGMRFHNDSDASVVLKLQDPSADGAAMKDTMTGSKLVLPPHSGTVRIMAVQLGEKIRAGTALNEMQFSLGIGEASTPPVTIRFPEGTAFGASGGTILEGKDLHVEPLFTVTFHRE